MRIKKVSQTTTLGAQSTNSYNESTENTYSCDYTNKLHKYTLEEHVVGKTEDGKNVYAKDILVGDLEAGVEKGVSTGVNIDKLFNLYGFYKFAGFNIPVNYYNYTDNKGGYCYHDYINSNIRIRSSYGGTDCFVTLIYTKTTD